METNRVGTDEFCEWSRRAGTSVYMAVNLGPQAWTSVALLSIATTAAACTAICALPTAIANHAVKLWCLGNEMDAPWQLGHKDANDYGKLAAVTASAMKWVDPTIELVKLRQLAPGHAHLRPVGSYRAGAHV